MFFTVYVQFFMSPYILVASSPHDVVAIQPSWLLIGPDSEVSLVCSATGGNDNRFIWLHNASNVVCGSNCPISSSFIQGKFYLKD